MQGGPDPRARALALGVEGLGDGDLASLVLGPRGPDVLSAVGGLRRLARATPRELGAKRGVGTVRALRLAAAVELGRRAQQAAAEDRPRLGCSADVAAYLAPRLAGLLHEEMWVVSLDGRHRLRAARRVAQGGLHGCAVAARDILRAALGDAASAFVLAHNHPSGDPLPSPEDVAMTRAVAEGGRAVGVPLVDHVILAGASHASLLELGLLAGLDGALLAGP